MKRYKDFGSWLEATLGRKTQKISVNAGFSCPNRDGRVGWGGCTFCNNQTFNPAYCAPKLTVREQLEEGKHFFLNANSGRRRQQRGDTPLAYLAYFQAYTNTYGDLPLLRQKYEEALDVEGVAGIVIGTRPDCVDDRLLNYLATLHQHCFVMVEYGIESTDDEVLQAVNRGHGFAQTVAAVEATARRGIPTGGHIILGLPGTHGRTDYLATEARRLNQLPLTTLKIHQLQLIRGTRMAEEYFENPKRFHLYSADEYIDSLIDFIEMLRPDLVLERFVSQSPAALLAVPGWGLKNHEFTARLQRRMEARDTWQGKRRTS